MLRTSDNLIENLNHFERLLELFSKEKYLELIVRLRINLGKIILATGSSKTLPRHLAWYAEGDRLKVIELMGLELAKMIKNPGIFLDVLFLLPSVDWVSFFTIMSFRSQVANIHSKEVLAVALEERKEWPGKSLVMELCKDLPNISTPLQLRDALTYVDLRANKLVAKLEANLSDLIEDALTLIKVLEVLSPEKRYVLIEKLLANQKLSSLNISYDQLAQLFILINNDNLNKKVIESLAEKLVHIPYNSLYGNPFWHVLSRLYHQHESILTLCRILKANLSQYISDNNHRKDLKELLNYLPENKRIEIIHMMGDQLKEIIKKPNDFFLIRDCLPTCEHKTLLSYLDKSVQDACSTSYPQKVSITSLPGSLWESSLPKPTPAQETLARMFGAY